MLLRLSSEITVAIVETVPVILESAFENLLG